MKNFIKLIDNVMLVWVGCAVPIASGVHFEDWRWWFLVAPVIYFAILKQLIKERN